MSRIFCKVNAHEFIVNRDATRFRLLSCRRSIGFSFFMLMAVQPDGNAGYPAAKTVMMKSLKGMALGLLMRRFSKLEIVIRSWVFHATAAVCFIPLFLLTPLAIVLPEDFVKGGFHLAIRTYLGLLKHICGLDYELRGRGNIPNRPVLFASKQLSAWDSAVLPVLLRDPAVISRNTDFRSYGPVMKRMQHLPISRPATLPEMAQLIESAKDRIRSGQSVLIFPEGTRMPLRSVQAGEYKRGVVVLYKGLGVPCVPIALNSGLFWQKRSFIRYPGTIIVEILPEIAPGFGSAEFVSILGDRIESNSQRLIQETITLHQRHNMQFFAPETTGGKTAAL